MKLEKPKTYSSPKYPQEDALENKQDWLNTHSPLAWKNRALVVGAMLLLFAGNVDTTALAEENPIQSAHPPRTFQAEARPDITRELALMTGHGMFSFPIAAAKSIIAPLFLHGDGTGATGCVVVTPPVYLSEAEARKIIIGEFKKEGVTFEKMDVKIPEIATTRSTGDPYNSKNVKIPFVLDAYSSKYNLGIEYVGSDEYFDLGGKRSLSTAQDYNTKNLSENIRKKLENYGKINSVVYYDPLVKVGRGSGNFSRSKSGALATSRKQLQAQVKDSIAWLKQKGIIKK